MPTETEFLNGALGKIRATRITSIDDGSVNANYCLTYYEPARHAALRAIHWAFATGRVQLSQVLPAPAFEYTYAYALPADWLRMRDFNGWPVILGNYIAINGAPVLFYKIEGKQLVTNYSPVYIKYTKDVPDINQWDSIFYQYLQCMLAADLALPITGDDKKSANLLNQAIQIWLPQAIIADEQDSAPPPVDSLTRGR